MVAHRCGYEYVSEGYFVVQKLYHSVDTGMVAHQCGYEYVSVGYLVL